VLLALLGMVLVLALKIVPTYTEYRAIQNAIVTAKAGGGSVWRCRSPSMPAPWATSARSTAAT
jgi:hypothetical protein